MKKIKEDKLVLNGKKVATKETVNSQEIANDFYKQTLTLLKDSPTPYLLGGGYAMFEYTGIVRDMKDLDIFCKPSEYQYHLKYLNDKGYQTEITDARWLAKVF